MLCTHIYIYTQMYIYIRVYIYMQIFYVYTYIHIYVYVHVYVYKYIYILDCYRGVVGTATSTHDTDVLHEELPLSQSVLLKDEISAPTRIVLKKMATTLTHPSGFWMTPFQCSYTLHNLNSTT